MTKNLEIDLLKSVKARSRQEEISSYGKLISMRKSVTKNKKKYSRKMKHARSRIDSYYFYFVREVFIESEPCKYYGKTYINNGSHGYCSHHIYEYRCTNMGEGNYGTWYRRYLYV